MARIRNKITSDTLSDFEELGVEEKGRSISDGYDDYTY